MPSERPASRHVPALRSRSRKTRLGAAPLAVITGLSGSGKGSVLRTLEDLGYYCVDNLPISLIPIFVDLYGRSSGEVLRAALAVDIREGDALKRFPHLFRKLRRTVPARLVFVEATDEALGRRFSETRRPHPLGTDRPVREGIRRERALLKPVRLLADLVIDTTRFSPHELRRFITERFAEPDRGPLLLSLVSFGYRYGIPPDADLVFDVRFLPNPNFVPALKPLTGKDRRVARYVFSFPQTREFVGRLSRLLAYLIPHYVREGKSYLTIAFGCTGGRHRSVAIAQALRQDLNPTGLRIKVSHRDVLRGSES
ncbi:MAG: RNase adapter RapZ [Terriglobia bacterium]